MEPQYDPIASHYAGARNDPVTLFLEMPSVANALGDVSGKSVVDFACGTGHYTRFFADLGATAVLGLDISTAMVEVARYQEKRSPRGIQYIVGDAAEERVFGKFDVATAVFLFNYADDARTLEKMFSNVAANLKPDGELVAVVPDPNFVNGLGDTIKYGFLLHVIETRPANLRVRMDFLEPESFSVKFTQWDRLPYETAMRRSGFEEIAWIPFSVSPEGVARQGEAYWTELLDNPKSIVLRAKKRR